MGVRYDIKLEYYDKGNEMPQNDDIYLYSHWDSNLGTVLAQALIRGKDRWNDSSYLARIIFSEMIKEDIEGNTGYGIAPYQMGDTVLTVNLVQMTVEGIPFSTYIDEEVYTKFDI